VFAGGWALDAVAAVCAGDGIAEWEVLDLVDALAQKSLVHLDEGVDGARYRLLETVRQYAAEHLATSGQEAVVRDRHLAWCVALAEAAEPRLWSPEQATWLERLDREHDNVRAALEWSVREGRSPTVGLQLAGALWRFWYVHGHLHEGRSWLATALDRAIDASPAIRARALTGAGTMAKAHGDYAQARTWLEQGLALWHELGNRPGIADCLATLGSIADHQGEYGRAAALYEEALALQRELGDRRGIASSLAYLGHVMERRGDYAQATTLLEEALALQQALGDQWGMATSCEYLGTVIAAQRQWVPAARLLGTAEAVREDIGVPLPPEQQAGHDQAMRAALGDEAGAAAWAAGRALPLDEAIALALAKPLATPVPPGGQGPPGEHQKGGD
jgi:non-specific serine/threonine protein kinase